MGQTGGRCRVLEIQRCVFVVSYVKHNMDAYAVALQNNIMG